MGELVSMNNMPPLTTRIREQVEKALPGAVVQVEGAKGHFTIEVVSEEFRGKSLLQQQRLVYNAINDLIRGPNAPVHAVDSLITRTPA